MQIECSAQIRNPSTDDVLDVSIEVITPQKARILLDKSYEGQRNIRKRVVKSYVEQMEDGLWEMSAETIKLSPYGRLLDGQHRLTAVVESGKAQTFLVVKGVKEKSILTIDDGAKRSLADALKLSKLDFGFRASSIAASISSISSLVIANQLDIQIVTARSKRYRSVSENAALARRIPRYSSAVKKFHQLINYRNLEKIIPIGSALPIYYLLDQVNSVACFECFKTLEKGIPFSSEKGVNSPSFIAYEVLFELKVNKERRRLETFVEVLFWAFDKTLSDTDVTKYTPQSDFKLSSSYSGSSQIRELLNNIQKRSE